MMKKYGKYYADWTDEHGKRRRKAFPTAKGAQQHQTKEARRAALKKAPASAPSRQSSRRGKPPKARRATEVSPAK